MAATQARRPRPDTARQALRDLPARYWLQLHRVCWSGRPDVLIDHVLVGPSGIFVIRHLPGDRDGLDSADGRGPQHRRDVDATVSTEQGDIIRGVLPPRYRDRVRPVVCLSGDEELAEEVRGVLVTSLRTFEHVLRSSTPVLSTSEVSQVHATLDAHLEQVPATPGAARRPLLAALRVAAASAAVAATFIGAVVLGPEAVEMFGTRR